MVPKSIFHGQSLTVKKKTHLVGGIPTPLNNMSVGVTIPNIGENKIHVPNHQPVILYCFAG